MGSTGWRRVLRDEGGQSFVEFALILPVFVLFIAGLLQTGVFFYREVTLNDAVRAASRAAITCRVSPNAPNSPGQVGTNAANGLNVTWTIQNIDTGGSSSGSCQGLNAQPSNRLNVSGNASMGNLGFPILGSIFPSTDTKTVQVVVE